jgi:ATP-dependent Clp protease protease subunit
MKEEFNNKATSNVLVPSVRDKDGTGYDIFSLLLKERIIVVQGQVETGMAGVIISQLKYLESLDSSKPIQMMINSPGGSVIDGLAIYDIMREIKCPITTIGNGMQASMGSILLAGGDDRYMTKNSMVLVHQIMGGAASGTQHTDFEIDGAFMALLHERLKSVYVEFTGLNHKFWDIVGERNSWLTAEQASKIGFINKGIIQNHKASGPYAADAVRTAKEGLQQAFDGISEDKIGKMSADDILKVINSGNAAGGVYSRVRGELIVKLAEFPEFWTETKKLEAANLDKLPKTANDNSGKTDALKKKTGNGPSA